MENGKENIIRRIAEDTKAKVKDILADAEKQKQSIIDEANAYVENEKAKAENRLQLDADEQKRRAKVNADMDARKYALSEKQKLISTVFDKVHASIRALSKDKYSAFMDKLLNEYAQKGETLVCAECDKDVFKTLADKHGVKLATNYGSFDGGFVLIGDGYEKNVTIDTIVSEARLAYEPDVVKIVFDGE